MVIQVCLTISSHKEQSRLLSISQVLAQLTQNCLRKFYLINWWRRVLGLESWHFFTTIRDQQLLRHLKIAKHTHLMEFCSKNLSSTQVWKEEICCLNFYKVLNYSVSTRKKYFLILIIFIHFFRYAW